jgi:hypothetical protein
LKDRKKQAYADDMVLVPDWEENFSKLINKAKQFLDFGLCKLNHNKYEVASINPSRNDNGIVINGARKEYITSNNFIKYLGIPLGSRRFWKTKFIETKVLEEIDKLEFSGLAFNQMLRVIKNFITNKLYFCSANMEISRKYLDIIDRIKLVLYQRNEWE